MLENMQESGPRGLKLPNPWTNTVSLLICSSEGLSLPAGNTHDPWPIVNSNAKQPDKALLTPPLLR